MIAAVNRQMLNGLELPSVSPEPYASHKAGTNIPSLPTLAPFPSSSVSISPQRTWRFCGAALLSPPLPLDFLWRHQRAMRTLTYGHGLAVHWCLSGTDWSFVKLISAWVRQNSWDFSASSSAFQFSFASVHYSSQNTFSLTRAWLRKEVLSVWGLGAQAWCPHLLPWTAWPSCILLPEVS